MDYDYDDNLFWAQYYIQIVYSGSVLEGLFSVPPVK